MKKCVIVVLIVLMLNWLGFLTLAEPQTTWKIGHVRGEGSAIDLETRWLTDTITTATGGRITFDIHPASKLGDYTVVLEQCAFGDIALYIAPFGVTLDKKLALPFTPYLVMNWAEAKRVYARDSLLLKTMASVLETHNLKLLGGWPVYFGGIVLTKEAPSPADPNVPKNLNLRVPPIKTFELTAQTLGYTPNPITWVYAMSGLKTGMVAGLMGGGAEGYLGLKDQAKFYLVVNDHFEYWFIYMNLDLWKALSADDQKTVQQTVDAMENRRWQAAEADEQANLKRLAEQGTKVITFSETELAAMAAKVRQEVWPVLSKDLGKEFDDLLADVKR